MSRTRPVCTSPGISQFRVSAPCISLLHADHAKRSRSFNQVGLLGALRHTGQAVPAIFERYAPAGSGWQRLLVAVGLQAPLALDQDITLWVDEIVLLWRVDSGKPCVCR